MPTCHLGLGQHARPNEPLKIAFPRPSADLADPLIQIKVTFNLNPNLNCVLELFLSHVKSA